MNAKIFPIIFLQILTYCNSLPLSTNSRWIVDQKSGNRVKLACANWPSHMDPMVAEGLEKQPIGYITGQLVLAGFNCVRFTWATFMFTRADYGSLTVSQSLDRFNLIDAKAGIAKNNPQFLNMTVVDVHKAVVNELGKKNIMVVLDNQVSLPQWCCSGDDGNGFFGDANFNPDEWLQGLTVVARAYNGNPAVVGMSLRNELRGGKQNKDNWYKYMQQGAEAIHKESPDFLVIVSGLNFDTNLRFLKTRRFEANVGNKLVFEGHWYGFGTPAERWKAQTNQLCRSATSGAVNNFLYLTTTRNPNPLFLSEFGMDQRGVNEADNKYITCLLAKLAEMDVDWGLWGFQGSYILRQGVANLEEFYGVMDIAWDRPRNPSFVHRLRFIGQINQVPNSSKPTTYTMFHPLSGQCVQVGKMTGIYLGDCRMGSRWEDHQEGGPIKLSGSSQCLAVGGEGMDVQLVSNDCSGNGSRWKRVSASGLHLAAQDAQGKYLCLEGNGNGNDLITVITRRCMCVRDDLSDVPTCHDNPQLQWFNLVPVNV